MYIVGHKKFQQKKPTLALKITDACVARTDNGTHFPYGKLFTVQEDVWLDKWITCVWADKLV